MHDDATEFDELLQRLRARAADPRRRADVIVSRFDANTRALDLGGLLSQLGGIGGLLRQTVAANREGRVDPTGHARALEIEADMKSPATTDLPPPADPDSVAAVESRLGFALPVLLQRIYVEVADGGFGPGEGLFGTARVAATYESVQAHPVMPAGARWPEGLLPIVDRNPGYDCIDARTGRVITWDPERLTERSSDRTWQRTFSEIAPSLEAWLDEWVGSKTLEEQMAERIALGQVEEARKARAQIRAMTPQERAAMGLPEVGWEKVVWGGIGWDPNEDT
jgi:hypothetical protein